ncbi:MAG: GAF domain-containing sensor histidine kinase [Anaerolineae bacterium]|nr:GAF domain-containing sensor histidine kinase [Anaerolineae bacterium]MDW8174008.1 GAF domain-containing sensor histidine kinase [Anaerolineae bacterium]
MINIVLDRLKEIASAVLYATEGSNLEAVLERIAEVAKEMASTKYAALGIPNGVGGLRYFKTAGMTDEQIALIDHLPKGHGLIGAIMRERETLCLKDMSLDSRSVGFPDNHPHMTSLLGVPIKLGSQLFGVLYLCDKVDNTSFTDVDQMLIETLASYAALAISSASLNEQHSRLRLLEERERIGMELHDGVIQSLYGIGMHVELLRMSGNIRAEDMQPLVDSLNEVIEDIRSYIGQLRHRSNQTLTLRDCFLRVVERLNLSDQLEVTIDTEEMKLPFTPAVMESIYLIINEAVSNAARHADATRLHLSARSEGGHLLIQISDDGKGFSVEEAHLQGGLGLRNMQRRARLYGGEVLIDSRPFGGTRLTIRVPLRAY